MAKLLMSCDDYVYRCNGKFYAKNKEKWDFYQRYLRVFEQLRLVTRCVDEFQLGNGRVLLDDLNIEYVPISFYRGPIEYAKQYFAIRKEINDVSDGCDAAVVRLPSTVAQRVCKSVMRKGLPYCVEVVYDSYDGFLSSDTLLTKILNYKIYKDLCKSCYNANGVSCVTEHYLQHRYYSKKHDAFYSHYSSLSLDKSFYTSYRHFPSKDRLTIAHVSSQVAFNGRKGYNQLLQAIAKLKDEGVDVNVRFAGESYCGGKEQLGNYARELGISDRISFTGNLSRTDLDSYLNECDLYVMPTKAEGLPRVIIEALAKGLPVITTPVSGNPELVSDYFLVDYYDISTLAERIKELISNKDLYEQASKENFERSLVYEASILEKRRDSFYQQLKTICCV